MKDKYLDIVASGKYLPIFSQPWWLDIVCRGGNWDVIISEEKGIVEGVLPYYKKNQVGFSKIGMPVLTPYLGCTLFYPNNINYANQISFENRVVKSLYEKMPDINRIDQILSPAYSNWLPLKWLGYKQNSLVTYQLQELNKLENPIEKYHYKTRNIIRKHENEIVISEENDTSFLFDMLKSTIEEKNGRLIADQATFQQLYEASHERNQGALFKATNKVGQILASGIVVWDDRCAYYLFRARNKAKDSSGALSVMTHHIISNLPNTVNTFDFLGSNLEEVEKFVRKFGTVQVPVHFVWKNNSWLYGILNAFRQ